MEYRGKEYPAYCVEIPGWGDYIVNVKSLEDALLPDGNYADDEARWIDEQIFFYVPGTEIEREDLGKYVAKNVI